MLGDAEVKRNTIYHLAFDTLLCLEIRLLSRRPHEAKSAECADVFRC